MGESETDGQPQRIRQRVGERERQTDGQPQRIRQRVEESETDRWTATEGETKRKREQDRQMDNHRG